ncbi:hypothetical protein EXIGLDRAFT_722816 [Exidia glandulosa HHB12029]|uniref:Uncharacterized protein n=1 Tax=Exidia glandulosa HHB12029 TaxID=1314781 RepID=A0A165F383_EXIGL|nr:hypothetical protein EXIGLDRAFT_722816 [Exidia glandulosa HHB12029]
MAGWLGAVGKDELVPFWIEYLRACVTERGWTEEKLADYERQMRETAARCERTLEHLRPRPDNRDYVQERLERLEDWVGCIHMDWLAVLVVDLGYEKGWSGLMRDAEETICAELHKERDNGGTLVYEYRAIRAFYYGYCDRYGIYVPNREEDDDHDDRSSVSSVDEDLVRATMLAPTSDAGTLSDEDDDMEVDFRPRADSDDEDYEYEVTEVVQARLEAIERLLLSLPRSVVVAVMQDEKLDYYWTDDEDEYPKELLVANMMAYLQAEAEVTGASLRSLERAIIASVERCRKVILELSLRRRAAGGGGKRTLRTVGVA